MVSVFQRPGVQQFLRFAMVGAVATGIQYVLLIALVEGAHVAKVAASALGYLGGGVANYLLNRRFTFANTQTKLHHGYAKFLVVNLIGLSLNTAIFATAIHLGAHYLFAQIIASGLVMIWNYAGARFFVFR